MRIEKCFDMKNFYASRKRLQSSLKIWTVECSRKYQSHFQLQTYKILQNEPSNRKQKLLISPHHPVQWPSATFPKSHINLEPKSFRLLHIDIFHNEINIFLLYFIFYIFPNFWMIWHVFSIFNEMESAFLLKKIFFFEWETIFLCESYLAAKSIKRLVHNKRIFKPIIQ